jgi:hypothetical protein
MTYTTGEISPQQWIENLRLPNGKPPRLGRRAEQRLLSQIDQRLEIRNSHMT